MIIVNYLKSHPVAGWEVATMILRPSIARSMIASAASSDATGEADVPRRQREQDATAAAVRAF
jgi:hypothetical protein